jgi:hypothetical protein
VSNSRYGRKNRLSPEGRKPPDAYTTAELHQFLVADAVKLHATDLPWAVAAYDRIGRVERIGAEAAYQRVYQEVRSLTGRGMPVN